MRTIIKDTCCCGSVFEVEHDFMSHAQSAHATWLAAHKLCRDADVMRRLQKLDDSITITADGLESELKGLMAQILTRIKEATP